METLHPGLLEQEQLPGISCLGRVGVVGGPSEQRSIIELFMVGQNKWRLLEMGQRLKICPDTDDVTCSLQPFLSADWPIKQPETPLESVRKP